MFKVGDVVRLTANAKKRFLDFYKHDLSSYTLFSGPMIVVGLRKFAVGIEECVFHYPKDHRYTGMSYYWLQTDLELAVIAPPVNACKCELKVLMLRGCKCSGV